MKNLICRSCNSTKVFEAVNLGSLPIANELLKQDKLSNEIFPLNLLICENCYLGQVGETLPADRIFRDYRYLSSISVEFLDHAKIFANRIVNQGIIKSGDLIIEIACNDGYLLKNFVGSKYKILGIEPANNVAKIAEIQKIPVINEFFSSHLAIEIVKKYGHPKFVIANNVLAHVPDINDFMFGLSILASQETIITIENPSLLNLHKNNQFDTIYHEHYSYLSANSVNYLCKKFNLNLNGIEKIQVHGGSNRYWISSKSILNKPSLDWCIESELNYGLYTKNQWNNFEKKINAIKISVKDFLHEQLNLENKVFGYGAAAKASTIINFFDINLKEIYAIADKSPEKIGRFMPNKNFPIVNMETMLSHKPDHIIIFPWNIKNEIKKNLQMSMKNNFKLWTIIPEFELT